MADLGRGLLLKRAAQLRGHQLGPPEVRPWRPRLPEGWRGTSVPAAPAPQQPPSPQDLMNLPASWDYKNLDNLGPRGEQLPRGAVSWTPHGMPYYGDGLQGWWNGTVSRLTAPIDRPDRIIPDDGTFWQKVIGTVQNASDYVQNMGGEEGGVVTPLAYATRAASEVVKTGLEALGEPQQYRYQ